MIGGGIMKTGMYTKFHSSFKYIPISFNLRPQVRILAVTRDYININNLQL